MHYQAVTYGDTTTLTVIGNRIATVIPESHPKYEAVRDYFERTTEEEHDESYVERLIDVASLVGLTLESLSDRVSYAGGTLYFDAEPVHSSLADRIVGLVRASDEAEHVALLVPFLENLAQNPVEDSRNELWGFLTSRHYTLTRRGTFIGYKKVQADRRSITSGSNTVFVNGEAHTGYIPNPDGAVVMMSRTDVDHDRRQACSNGLHVGTFPHAFGFGGNDGTVLLAVEVNPRDVVSVPLYDATKMRVAKYRVLGEVDGEYQGEVWEDAEESVDLDAEFQAVAESLTEEEAETFQAEDNEDAWGKGDSPLDGFVDEQAEAEREAEDAQEGDNAEEQVDPATVNERAPLSYQANRYGWVADLLASDLGHRPTAKAINDRLGREVTTESSVRRYRKSNGL